MNSLYFLYPTLTHMQGQWGAVAIVTYICHYKKEKLDTELSWSDFTSYEQLALPPSRNLGSFLQYSL